MTLFLTLELIIKETFRGLFFVYISAYFVEKVCPNVSKREGSKKDLQVVKNQLLTSLCTQSRDRTGTGFTPLVFETSASTYSAIWASKAVQS